MVTRWRFTLAALAGLFAGASAPASAGVITFGSLSIDPLLDAGPQTEAGMTYEAVSGEGWEIQNAYGNPASALVTAFNSEGSAAGDALNIKRTGGGAFQFVSVDTSTFADSNSDEVQITGYLGATVVGTLLLNVSSSDPDSIVTVASSFAGLIDRLEVLVVKGNDEGTSNARLLDNFTFEDSAVPEPSSLALLALGAIGCGGVVLRRRAG